jgi:hypothetical protein
MSRVLSDYPGEMDQFVDHNFSGGESPFDLTHFHRALRKPIKIQNSDLYIEGEYDPSMIINKIARVCQICGISPECVKIDYQYARERELDWNEETNLNNSSPQAIETVDEDTLGETESVYRDDIKRQVDFIKRSNLKFSKPIKMIFCGRTVVDEQISWANLYMVFINQILSEYSSVLLKYLNKSFYNNNFFDLADDNHRRKLRDPRPINEGKWYLEMNHNAYGLSERIYQVAQICGLSASQVKIWYTRPKSSEPDKLIPLFESEDESSELQLDKIDIKETGKDREIVHGEIENPPMPDKVVPQQIKIAEGKVGVTYESLIGHVMRGETKITIQDPYVSLLYQLRNLIDFLDFVVRFKDPNQVAAVHLITRKNMDILDQETNLAMIAREIEKRGLKFTWEFNKEAHESYVILHNNKAEIALGRGLDIYTKPEANNLVADRLPICRSCHEFKVYIFPSDEE